MPTLEGLKLANEVNTANTAGIVANNQAFQKQEAATKASKLFKAGDIKGALSEIARVDPAHALEVGKQLLSADPATQGALKGAEKAGEQKALTDTGSNARQLLDAELAAGKYKKTSDREARLSNNFNQNMAFKYQQSAENNPTYKSAISVINEMPQLKSLLDDAYKNGGQSLAMLGPRIAKGLAGEVGVLTEQDVTRYISNPALARSILSKGEKAYEGKLTAVDYSNLVRLGTVMEKNAQDRLDKAYKQAATKMSRNLNIPLDEAELLVNPNIDEQTKSILAEPHAESKESNPDLSVIQQIMDAEDWLDDPKNAKHPKRESVKQKIKDLGL